MKPVSHDIQTDREEPIQMSPNAVVREPSGSISPVTARPSRFATAKLLTDEEIDSLGTQQDTRMAGFSQRILANVRASDTDQFGSKLNELISTAKGLDLKAMQQCGVLATRGCLFKSTKERLLAQYESVGRRMDAPLLKLDRDAQEQKNGIADFEQMYNDNCPAHPGLSTRCCQSFRWLFISKVVRLTPWPVRHCIVRVKKMSSSFDDSSRPPLGFP